MLGGKFSYEIPKNNGLDEVIKSLEQPILGICLGLQLRANTAKKEIQAV